MNGRMETKSGFNQIVLTLDIDWAPVEDAASFTNRDEGAGRLFSELVDHLNGRGESWTIGDIYREWRSEEILP